jgi:hypothetical protein
MPRKGKKKNKNNGQPGNGGRTYAMVTSKGIRLDLPLPRLPRWLGTPNLSSGNAVYPRVNLDVPILISSQAVAAGAIAFVSNIDTTAINNFAGRFGATFKEFAIVGARYELRITNVTNPQGMVLAYIDETSNAAPTSTSLNYSHAELPIVASSVDSTGSMHRVEWVAKSYTDLDWDAIGTAGTVGYLKLFASNASTGTAAATTASIVVSGCFAICFRGYI